MKSTGNSHFFFIEPVHDTKGNYKPNFKDGLLSPDVMAKIDANRPLTNVYIFLTGTENGYEGDVGIAWHGSACRKLETKIGIESFKIQKIVGNYTITLNVNMFFMFF